MLEKQISSADTKPHYNILDGLRGIAAIVVVCFHLFEAFATSHLDPIVACKLCVYLKNQES